MIQGTVLSWGGEDEAAVNILSVLGPKPHDAFDQVQKVYLCAAAAKATSLVRLDRTREAIGVLENVIALETKHRGILIHPMQIKWLEAATYLLPFCQANAGYELFWAVISKHSIH